MSLPNGGELFGVLPDAPAPAVNDHLRYTFDLDTFFGEAAREDRHQEYMPIRYMQETVLPQIVPLIAARGNVIIPSITYDPTSNVTFSIDNNFSRFGVAEEEVLAAKVVGRLAGSALEATASFITAHFHTPEIAPLLERLKRPSTRPVLKINGVKAQLDTTTLNIPGPIRQLMRGKNYQGEIELNLALQNADKDNRLVLADLPGVIVRGTPRNVMDPDVANALSILLALNLKPQQRLENASRELLDNTITLINAVTPGLLRPRRLQKVECEIVPDPQNDQNLSGLLYRIQSRVV